MLPVAMLASGAASLFANGLSNLGAQFLQKADKDNSNGVSLSEFANIMQGGQNMPASSPAPATSATPTEATKAKFGKVDANADGELSTDEVNAYNQQLVSQIQASLIQLQQMYGAGQPQQGGHHQHKSLSDQFTAIDANADGAVSKDEMASFFAAKDAANGNAAGKDPSAKVAAIFDKVDTNADGKLSTAEVTAFDAARKSKKQGADATTQDTLAQITKLMEAIQKQASETTKKGSAASALAAATAYKAA